MRARITDFGVVVLSFDDGPADDCIQMLLASGLDPSRALVVHNPGVSRSTFDALHGVSVINMATNVGYGIAMNRGMEWWRDKGLSAAVLLTHDVLVDTVTLASLVEMLQGDVAAVGPALRTPGGQIFTAGAGMDRWGNIWHLGLDGNIVRTVDWLDGSVLAVDLSKAPPFRQDFFMYWEDVAFGMEIRKLGWRLVVDSALQATSVPGSPSRADTFAYLMWRNRLRQLRSERMRMAVAYTLGRLTLASLRRRRPLRIYAAAAWDGLAGGRIDPR